MPPIANAGSDLTVFVGEPVYLDGSASTGYSDVSQSDGTWSTRWTTGDGYDIQNLVKGTHVYQQAGIYTATLTVKNADGSMSHSDTATITVQDIPAASGGNLQTLTDTGNTATNRTNLQNAIDAAAANANVNEIVVPAGFVADGPLRIPARTATTYVTVRVANADTNLPPRTRVTAADAADMFRIIANDPGVMGTHYPIELRNDSQYFRFIGMQVQRAGGSATLGELIGVDMSLGTGQTNHIIVDRCVLDGNNKPVGRGVAANGRYWSVINSSIVDIKAPGVETKAVAQWVGEGPIAVVNNRLEAAAINFMIGGVDVGSDDLICKGLVFRGNYVWKNPAWLGGGYSIKNLFELKYGHNNVVAGNIFENNWLEGQSGEGILIKSTTQGDGPAPYNEVRGVDFRNNKVLNVRAGFNVIGRQSLSGAPHPPYANHIRFFNNLWTEHDTSSWNGSLIQRPAYFELTHNTWIALASKGHQFYFEDGSNNTEADYKAPGLKILNNLTMESAYGWFSSFGSGSAAMNQFFTGWDARRNVLAPANGGTYPADNFKPSSYYADQFENYAGGDYRLKSTSPYKGQATDGTDIGCDITVLNAATADAVDGTWTIGTGGGSAPLPGDTNGDGIVTQVVEWGTGTRTF